MKKSMNTRQMKRKLGVDMKEVYSLFEQLKEDVSHIEGNVAKNHTLFDQPISTKRLFEDLGLEKESLTAKDVVSMLTGKIKLLDQKMFELKQENQTVTFKTKPKVTISLYSEKAHD